MGQYDQMGIDVSSLLGFLDKQKNQDSNYWKPEDGNSVIRILPPNPKINPKIQHFFQETTYHDIEGQRYYCPQSLAEKPCPLCEARKKIYVQAKREGRSLTSQEENYVKAFMSKRRYTANIVVRGEEDKGVRLWEFGIKMLEKLAEIMSIPDYGDITNVSTGRDFVVVKGQKAGFPNYDNSLCKPNSSPLGSESQIDTWMNSQFELTNRIVDKVLSYDELFKVAFSADPKDFTTNNTSNNNTEKTYQKDEDFPWNEKKDDTSFLNDIVNDIDPTAVAQEMSTEQLLEELLKRKNQGK